MQIGAGERFAENRPNLHREQVMRIWVERINRLIEQGSQEAGWNRSASKTLIAESVLDRLREYVDRFKREANDQG